MKKKLLPIAETLFFSITLVTLIGVLPCCARQKPDIPAPLTPWVEWALHGHEEMVQCVSRYNDSDRLQCSWPTELNLTLTDSSGKFTLTLEVNHESRILLPGNEKQWPLDVREDNNPVVVTTKNNSPAINLKPGTHTITGSFIWPRLPEYIQIPPKTGLVSLAVNDRHLPFPNVDTSGRIWLKSVDKDEKIENRLKIESFRLIDDNIPARMTLRFSLDVAGSARETTLGPLYPSDLFIPLSLQSSLPAKLEEDGRIKIQLRPGRHELNLQLRHVGPLEKLTFGRPEDGFWPQVEVWSFLSRPTLRLVETSGAPSIDPLQTSLPGEWRKYPAYRIQSGETLHFKEIKRGDPQPPPDQLTLDRSIWLRFDGSGYTIQDQVKGQKNTNWRLEMLPSIDLGKVVIDGKPQAITRMEGLDKKGIELRKGIVNLTADSLFHDKLSKLPATGWDHDFQAVKGRIYLPPGWKLLTAGGIDNIRRTWVKRWTLLDFFLVLIFTIAIARLFALPVAALSFATLVLIFHEPGAPRYIWLALLIGFALLKYLPDGKFKRLVTFYQAGATLLLIMIVIPYAIHSLRIGIYPQLARPYYSMIQYSLQKQQVAAPPQVAEQVLDEEIAVQKSHRMIDKAEPLAGRGKMLQSIASSRRRLTSTRSQVMQYDPKALTQTGPGLPQWRPFETIPFSWSGPVSRNQSISFTLLGPRTNLILAFLRVGLIIALGLSLFGQWLRQSGCARLTIFKSVFILCCCLAATSIFPQQSFSGDIPDQHMLDQLRERLLEQEDCFPHCADIQNVDIQITSDELSIGADVDAQIRTAIPIPGHVKHWLPNRIIIDTKEPPTIMREDNHLWLLVPKGKHTISMSGPIRRQNSLQLVFPLKPHYAKVDAEGWSVSGLHAENSFDSQLQFKRMEDKQEKKAEILETGVLPQFARIERNILLGLDRKVETTIQRIGPTGSPMILDIPLLPGESVTSENIRVENGVARINFNPTQSYLRWESFLEPTDAMTMTHAITDKWTEIWKVDVSPVYHMDYQGIPVILHKSGNRWYPTWHPWPGETVTLNISRPSGAKGRTMTIEKSYLQLRPGNRSTSAQLDLTINSSQGEQHTILLPPKAELVEVAINGKVQLIRQEGQQVVLPITPGSQTIALKWREDRGITNRYQTSAIDLGSDSVNSNIDLYLPANRWPLFIGGEQLVGPAVLFWSVVIMIFLVAAGLAKTSLTPLKFHQWLLLGIGMSMSNLAACLIVVGWLITLKLKEKAPLTTKNSYNAIQIGIVLLTIGSIASLLYAISHGLLGHPDMNITGNGSRSDLLRWYQDISDPTLPRAWVFSIPMLAYRATMLAWALWISFWLISILKWGWGQFTSPVIWQASDKKNKSAQPDK